jgi:hypothetical protein
MLCIIFPFLFATILSQIQGDQIGRIFAYWAIHFFGQFFEDWNSRPKKFPWSKLCINFVKKYVGWATVWATSSQSHLVTLPFNRFSQFLSLFNFFHPILTFSFCPTALVVRVKGVNYINCRCVFLIEI